MTEARMRPSEPTRRAQAGERAPITRRGRVIGALKPLAPGKPVAHLPTPIDEVHRTAAGPISKDESAARSQDFLHDEDGLPQ